MSTFEPALIGVIAIGLLHGLEPGHGWPIALLYAARTTKPTIYAFISSGVISLFHFISSITVVVIYVVASSLIDFTSPILKYISFAALVLLAIKLFTEKVESELESQHGHFHDNAEELQHEHEHEHPETGFHAHMHFHPKRTNLNLWKIASCAFLLGFAHEEEFALLALVVGGVNPLLLMVAYGLAVTAGLVGITVLGVKMYEKLKAKISRYEKYIPKISGIVLLTLAFGLLVS
ncbi:MAG: nickel/cobalt transporter [Candidatus Bathyarchaeota archaeon]|nr:nickel/cobalt transporter [Candidatus Bathyarchaeota archaeon]